MENAAAAGDKSLYNTTVAQRTDQSSTAICQHMPETELHPWHPYCRLYTYQVVHRHQTHMQQMPTGYDSFNHESNLSFAEAKWLCQTGFNCANNADPWK